MHYLSIIDHNTNKRVAFLQNAYNVGYAKELNALWSASFTLPLSDPKNAYCDYFNYVEMYDDEEYVGLFRIMPTRLTKSESTNEVTYDCEHVLATLMDDILFGWHEIGNLGVYTTQVLRYVLDAQTVRRWQLGECDFAHQYLYGWENENLLSALFSVPNAFVEEFRWEFDTTSMPWTISLKAAASDTKGEIRYRKNMRGIKKSVDPTNLCTRLYALGYGEGDNQLTIAKLNDGKKYLDADTQSRYGIVTKVWIDQRYQLEDSLYQAALAMLEELKVPLISYSVDSVHIGELHKCNVGDRIRVIDDEEEIDFYARIISISKPDVVGAPAEATITIANATENIATSIADLNDRQRVAEAYSQGSTTLFTQSFYDNCSPDVPAEIRFYIPENAVHLNQILLQGRPAPFRGYSKATKGGGASSSTTSSGGGSYGSTASGGGSSTTSGSGGSSAQSSDAVTLYSSNTVHDSSDDGGPGNANHNHGLSRGDKLALWADGDTVSGYAVFVPSGKHTHPAHAHNFNIPSHTHSVSIPSHSHSISISPHSHSFSLPDHTHEITYGIYSGTTATRLAIKVDNNAVGSFSGSINDLNLIDHLSKDSNGNVSRGWHTISITPDVLSRVEFDLVIQLFANSRGGGQY